MATDITFIQKYLARVERTIYTLREEIRILSEKLRDSENGRLSDSLTGLHNFDYLVEKIEELKNWVSIYNKKCAETGRFLSPQYLCFGFVDLNELKFVNDQYGHEVGDEALRFFAQQLVAKTRASDIVVRKSGDEFVLMMPFQDRRDIARAKKRLNHCFKSLEFRFEDTVLKLSASFGYNTAILSKDLDYKECIKKADLAMYRNKIKIKNKTGG